MGIKERANQYGTFDGPYYLAVWKGMFQSVLGWSGAQTEEWASRYRGFLTDPNDIMFHETPIYWAALAFIPASLRERLDRDELLKLKQKICSAAHADPDDADPTIIDWGPFRLEVEQILAEYACHEAVTSAVSASKP